MLLGFLSEEERGGGYSAIVKTVETGAIFNQKYTGGGDLS